jgi:hypothetical protein
MDLVGRSRKLNSDLLAQFRKARQTDYKKMIISECLVGENVCTETLDQVTRREIAAGRMAPDDNMRAIADKGMAAPYLTRSQLLDIEAKRKGTVSAPIKEPVSAPIKGLRRLGRWITGA